MNDPMGKPAPLAPAELGSFAVPRREASAAESRGTFLRNDPDGVLERTVGVVKDPRSRPTQLADVTGAPARRAEIVGVLAGPAAEAWAARIAACVNACTGVPTSDLVELAYDGGILAFLDQAVEADLWEQRYTVTADPFLPHG